MSDRSVRIDDGGPAFPQIKSAITAFDEDGVPLGSGITGFDRGMCLRDWFAGMAMQGLLAKEGCQSDTLTQTLIGTDPSRDAEMFAFSDAERAYCYADAMLAARKAGGK
jgi:hypothetical protein